MFTLASSRRALVLALALVAGTAVVTHALAQEAGRAAAPGPEAARVARMAGEWELQTSMGEGAPEAGTSSCRLMAGGWLIEDVKSAFMGAPFEGHGVFGWDAKQGTYVSVWVDSMEPKLTQHESTWDEARQAFVTEPQMHDMGSGPTRMHNVLQILGDDAMLFTLTPDQPDAKPVLTIRYTRKR
jgi:hypothetical protein